jgi:serralysin
MAGGLGARFCLGVAALAAVHFGALDAAAWDIVNRWSATQVNGGGLQRGDPVTLRWSVVPDGGGYSRSATSQLIDFLDDGWNVAAVQRTPDFTNRPWWSVINNAYAQYARVSGVSLVYVAEQTAAGASTGMSGDVRIGGENLDGTPGGALADNTFPDDGDMRIDTTRESNGSIGAYFSTEPGLRNLVIHETGHGVGLGHVEFVNNSGKAIMEPGLRTEIWGLQFDDVYALNRQYGDPRERNGGNNVVGTANFLGNLGTTGLLSIGTDATDSAVDQFDGDWVGIDGSNDADWFRFSVTGECFANIRLTPVGPSYTTVAQGNINTAAMSDLAMQFFKGTPTVSQLLNVNAAGIGAAEVIPAQLLSAAGDYLVRVRGTQDFNQFYRLDISLSEVPAAGTSADVNLDGVANIADWQAFLAGAYGNFAGLSQRDAFRLGDLDLDGDNDVSDFRHFKSAYSVAHGAGSFAAMLQVPEPPAVMLAGCAVMTVLGVRRRAG